MELGWWWLMPPPTSLRHFHPHRAPRVSFSKLNHFSIFRTVKLELNSSSSSLCIPRSSSCLLRVNKRSIMCSWCTAHFEFAPEFAVASTEPRDVRALSITRRSSRIDRAPRATLFFQLNQKSLELMKLYRESIIRASPFLIFPYNM